VNFSSSFYAPVNWVGSTGSLELNNSLLRSSADANAGLSDVFFSPLTVGIHFSDTKQSCDRYQDLRSDGAYRFGSLTNLGMNEWTISRI
jgi:hypothetical protein